MTSHLNILTRELPDTEDVQASDVSVFMQGKVTAQFPCRDVTGKPHTVYLHSFNPSLIEPIAEVLTQYPIVNRAHLYRILQLSLEMGTA